MTRATSLDAIERRVVRCRLCPRLVAWREEAAAHPPKRFRGQTYWARPVPGFGDPAARLLVLGLAPAAHGGNRTGRVFTGDSSGAFLFSALHRAGFANQASSVSRGDGLALTDCWVTAPVKCAPPDNKPLPAEFVTCRPWLVAEWRLLAPRVRAVVALGGIAWASALRVMAETGAALPRPLPKFGHGAEAAIGGTRLLGSYHVSQQNTNTGRLTPAMLDAVLARAKAALGTPR